MLFAAIAWLLLQQPATGPPLPIRPELSEISIEAKDLSVRDLQDSLAALDRLRADSAKHCPELRDRSY